MDYEWKSFKTWRSGVLAVKFPTVFGRLRQKRNPNQEAEKTGEIVEMRGPTPFHFYHGLYGFHGEYNLVLTDKTLAR